MANQFALDRPQEFVGNAPDALRRAMPMPESAIQVPSGARPHTCSACRWGMIRPA